MISFSLSNRLIFVFSLLGLSVASFLFYKYGLNESVFCPIGKGCDIVRTSSYSHILGIPIPFLGVVYYLTMALLSVVHSHQLPHKLVRKLQLLASTFAVGFGVYLTFLEVFVIRAYCFWCLMSFIISVVIFLAIVVSRYEIRN
ncbi:MAG: vitamin K epoxide reductase family protein [Candidatus Daviesbacteria bacterium]|nr:vitamin K epoxide reductase family protein [Candidatus Daviesbacteria bacterium]